MAKTISNDFSKTRISLKDKGTTYEVAKAFEIKHLMYEMKIGSTLRECEDGLFAAYDPTGNKCFFRFGDVMMKDVLQNLKLKEDEQPQS